MKLQVLICTYGENGIQRIAKCSHPKVEGVEYLVSWQASKSYPIPVELHREDFKIFKTDSIGLSKNRNNALAKATADILLISDDDVDYYTEGFLAIITAFKENPDIDIATFRYDSLSPEKTYPSERINIKNPTKGYYISSIEIAFRRDSVQNKIWFNENFGIGAKFPSGEEDIFLRDCMDHQLNGMFFPVSIARHDGTTTSERNLMLPTRPQTKGAVFLLLHPYTWPLRMLTHTLREIPLWKQNKVPNPLSYCYNWIKGAVMAKKAQVFPTRSYSKD